MKEYSLFEQVEQMFIPFAYTVLISPYRHSLKVTENGYEYPELK